MAVLNALGCGIAQHTNPEEPEECLMNYFKVFEQKGVSLDDFLSNEFLSIVQHIDVLNIGETHIQSLDHDIAVEILNEAKKYRKIYFVEEEVSKGITGNVIGGLISLYRPEVLNGLEHTIITHLPSIEKKLPKCSTKYRQQVSDSALCWP